MAAGGPVQELCDEATCPICLDYFTDPVTVGECGHNFCQACLTQCWGKEDVVASCPQCRETIQKSNLIPNRQLANFVAIARKFSLVGGKKTEKGGPLCEKHQEPLKLFCKNDKKPLCVVCDLEHRFHKVVLMEEASQEYKGKICSCLPVLKKQREQVLAFKADVEKEHQDLLNQTEAERQKMVAEFRQLYRFLEEQEQLLLAQMEETEKEIITRRDEYITKLSEELSSLESLIQEMEEKCQQPASELLQNIGSIMNSYEEKKTFENPVDIPLGLKWKIWDFGDINVFLEGVTKQFKDTLLSGLQLQKANVTLDPDTAHPQLIVSEDHQSMRLGCRAKNLPKNPERFDQFSIVLGCEEFTAGRHFWEVCVSPEEEWAVGVARKSLGRKGIVVFSPQEGIWALGKWGGGYRATTEPLPPFLSLAGELRRIRVSLNYAVGQVTFFDADAAAPIFTFSAASFSSEILQPFFWVYEKAHLSLDC
ncbi:zinc finger protein RFP-like [Tiliqua scincoides]|uniref:zinc finger protein RFP-like n=1 Tax=Tiliqua scincoides TaxID=71010 RepID=UPI003462D044